MQKSEFEFEILVNGKSVAEYAHQGKIFIEGKEDTEFTLKLRNNSSRRSLFVPTIDGLSVMDGKEASLDSSGYIVDAYTTENISGWRTSDDKVARFFFAKMAESYASKSGREGNVGVIGCAVFREKERIVEKVVIKEYIYPPIPRCPWGYHSCLGGLQCGHGNMIATYNCQAGGTMPTVSFTTTSTSGSMSAMTMNGSAQAMQANSTQLGTGFGNSKYEPVRTVSFNQEKVAACIFEIHYNTRKNLEAMGVEFKRALYASAKAFPKAGAYCEPPAGWQE